MEEPPILLDGARVREFAAFEAAAAIRHAFAAGVPIDNLAGLIIAEDLVEGGVFLLYCDDKWQTLAAERYPDAQQARLASQAQCEGLEWREYRALSAQETKEVETTRSFLRELVRDFPPGD